MWPQSDSQHLNNYLIPCRDNIKAVCPVGGDRFKSCSSCWLIPTFLLTGNSTKSSTEWMKTPFTNSCFFVSVDIYCYIKLFLMLETII